MAIDSSPASEVISKRRARRRQGTIEEALDHAVAIMTENGVGALSISEMARRMGIRGPSLYKYFDSLHAAYDLLFARALRDSWAAIEAESAPQRGVARVVSGTQALIAWAVRRPALAQLLFWRPVPGFAPSRETFAGSVDQMQNLRAELAEAVRLGELSEAADSDEAVRLLTVVMSGLISQQLANEPGVGYREGVFTRLTGEALDMYFSHYRPISPTRHENSGGTHAAPEK